MDEKDERSLLASPERAFWYIHSCRLQCKQPNGGDWKATPQGGPFTTDGVNIDAEKLIRPDYSWDMDDWIGKLNLTLKSLIFLYLLFVLPKKTALSFLCFRKRNTENQLTLDNNFSK